MESGLIFPNGVSWACGVVMALEALRCRDTGVMGALRGLGVETP